MVQRIRREAGLEAFINAVEKDGCVIIQDFTDLELLDKSVEEVQPYLDASIAETGSSVGALNGGTATCTRLVGRSRTVREKFFSDSLYQEIADYFIGLETRPDCKAQELHRDDKNHHARHEAASKYSKGRDMLIGLFVPTCDTFKTNGATRIIPGSHLWGDDEPDFGPTGDKGVIDAEMKRGEAFVMLGSLYHGAGNYTLPTGCRTVHIMFMCSGVHRQEEIPFLSYPIEDVKTYSKLVRDRLGWKQSEPNLGWVDLKSPEFLLE